jgi:uncharacterized protein YbjT (DUF2867 family)
MIVIMGATGTIGRALMERLIEMKVPARALSRDGGRLRAQLDQKRGGQIIEVAQADAADPLSLRKAFEGASQLFLVISNHPEQVAMETSVINIAVGVGIQHIVKISSPVFNPLVPVTVAGWHNEIEQVLQQSGIVHTILRPYAFMQNVLRVAPTIKTQNMFLGTMGDSVCNFVDSRDIADVAADALTRKEIVGQVYTLTGTEMFSYPQIADKLSNSLGRKINYINLDPKELQLNLMTNAGMPEWLARHVVEIQQMSVLVPEIPTDAVKHVLGREPRTMDSFLQQHIDMFR